MERIIDGLLYDTETASRICDLSPSGFSSSDFKWEETFLYRTKSGRFFIAGEGGALSRWSQRLGDNGRCGGSGLTPIDIQDAKALVERHGTAEQYTELFGPPEEA